MLTLRNISNVGAPLHSPNGDVLADVRIFFTLVDLDGEPVDGWDVLTKQRVGGTTTVLTDALGHFTVGLWPNDRGLTSTKYSCRMGSLAFKDFLATVPEGQNVMTWSDFFGSSLPVLVIIPGAGTIWDSGLTTWDGGLTTWDIIAQAITTLWVDGAVNTIWDDGGTVWQ